jgi:hypothetical protein
VWRFRLIGGLILLTGLATALAAVVGLPERRPVRYRVLPTPIYLKYQLAVVDRTSPSLGAGALVSGS